MANMIKVGDTFVNLDKVDYIESTMKMVDYSDGYEPSQPQQINKVVLVFGKYAGEEGFSANHAVAFHDEEADALRWWLNKSAIADVTKAYQKIVADEERADREAEANKRYEFP